MPQTDHDRVIALAGLFQAASLVSRIARHGQADSDELETCYASILKIDATSNAAVYGQPARLRSGLRLLIDQLQTPKDMEVTRYIVALLVLERKLARHAELQQRIRSGIDAVQNKLAFFPLLHDNTVALLADIYAETISTLQPRILVHGEQDYLTRPENANRIRALLLAGIRAAWLWRQSGGGRFTLLLARRRLLAAAQQLQAEIDRSA